jgi:hypothetical protein
MVMGVLFGVWLAAGTLAAVDVQGIRTVHFDLRHGATPITVGRGYQGNSFHSPSETTSTVPSVTLMAVWSSMAYAGPAISAAHLSASAMVFSGMSS